MSRSNPFRRALVVVVGLCTTTLMGVVAATPAHAAPPVDHSNFHPVELTTVTDPVSSYGTAGGPERADFLADKEDGKGIGAHLTAVATTDTTQVDWYFCPTSTTDPVSTAELGACTLIASDTTPRTPTNPTAIATADEAYDVTWDIPNSIDGQQRDIVSIACNGAPSAGAEPGANCRADLEDDIWLDSVETGAAPQTSTGEFHLIDPLPDGTFNAGNQKLEALHGITVPNDGFGVSSRTSPEMAGINMNLYGPTVDAQNEPVISTPILASTSGVLVATTALYKEWNSAGPLNPTDNAEHLLQMNDQNGTSFTTTLDDADGAGDPPSDPVEDCGVADGIFCDFDGHYIVSTARVPTQIHIHNDEDAAGGGDQGPTFCWDQNRKKTGDPDTGEADQVLGCQFDQFSVFTDLDADGDLEKDRDHALNTGSTFHITTGNASFAEPVPPYAGPTTPGTEACEGTARDLDGDGLFEYCSDDTPGFIHQATWVAITGGAVTIEYCADPDATAPTATGYGCGDAGTAKDSVTKSATARIDHNHLRLTSEATGNCHAGTASHTAPAGSVVNLTGCAQDAFHNGAPNTRVIWRIANDPNDPAQFVGAPGQTTDAAGKANAAVTANSNAGGLFSNIFFCGDANEDGVCDAQEAQFQISWTGGAGKNCSAKAAKVRRLRAELRQDQANDASKEEIAKDRKRLRRARAALRRCRRA